MSSLVVLGAISSFSIPACLVLLTSILSIFIFFWGGVGAHLILGGGLLLFFFYCVVLASVV